MKVGGIVRLPGDKSITHRALFLAALAEGRSLVRGALASGDTRSTARVLRQLGVSIPAFRTASRTPPAPVPISASGRLQPAARSLHCGNSGTTARLALGLLAAHDFATRLTGDRSLRRRPMRRVTDPLCTMGASVTAMRGDHLPLTMLGGPLRPLVYELPVSSAQVKAALLFAGLASGVAVDLREPRGPSRDHSERLLRGLGMTIGQEGDWIRFRPGGRVEPFEIDIPGDISSAAFLVGAALLADEGELRLEGVGLNPTRTGYLEVIRRMGGRSSVRAAPTGSALEEPVGDLAVRPSSLRATIVKASEVPGLIDEIPLLAVLASRADGETVFHEVGELRVKESNRLELLASNIRAVGGEADASGNTLTVEGHDRPPRGRVHTAGDHRLAMAFSIIQQLPGARVEIDDVACAEVSFPGFAETLARVCRRGGDG